MTAFANTGMKKIGRNDNFVYICKKIKLWEIK